jgi:hypothetical protein
MQKVKSMGSMYLRILSLHPGKLINHFIPPLVHAFISDVHLRIEDPEETKAL